MVYLFGLAGVTDTSSDVLFIVLFFAASVIIFFGAVALLGAFVHKPKYENADGETEVKRFNFIGMLLAVLAIGLIVRLLMVFIVKGYRDEYNIFTRLMDNITNNGMKSAYIGGSFSNYPVTVYIYSFMSWLTRLFGIAADSVYLPVFVKLPFIICDVLAALLLYRATKRYVNDQTALIIAAFFSFFPLFIFSSAVWGSLYSVLALLTVATFYFISGKNYLGTIAAYSLALLTMKDALYLFPVIAVYVIYNYIKYCTGLKKAGIKDFGGVMAHAEYRNIVLIPVYIVASVVLMYVVSLPIIVNQSASFFGFINLIFFKPLGDMISFGRNALGLYNLFGRNGTELVSTFPSAVFAVFFAVIITALTMLIYLSRRNRANLIFLGAFILFTLSVFFMDFSELSLVPALTVMLLSFVLIRDKRILKLFGGLSLAVMINGITVMAGAGYLNALTDSELAAGTYTGSVMLTTGFPLAVSIICTVMALIMYVYAVMVLLDLSMSNKRKLFADLSGSRNVIRSVKEFFKR